MSGQVYNTNETDWQGQVFFFHISCDARYLLDGRNFLVTCVVSLFV